MKNLWIIANWKSNKTLEEALTWVETVGPGLPEASHIKVAVCPDFVGLAAVKKAVKDNSLTGTAPNHLR